MQVKHLDGTLEHCTQAQSGLWMHQQPEVACIRVEGDWLLIEENHKANNGGDMLLHGKHIEAPMSLTAANIAHIQILLDLITACAKLHGDPIMALVHIPVDVPDGLDRCNRLHIDMAPILLDRVLGVTHHPSIVHLLPANLNSPASVAMPDASIGVLSD
jgi:hypothetical protein